MWKRIARVLSNKTIMLRLLITLLLLLGFRIISHIPIPILNTELYSLTIGSQQGFLGILDNFSGQALQRMSIMALGISPYITASIVVQLLQMVIPQVKEWAEQGEAGKQKINNITRYGALILAFIQGFALIIGIVPGVGNQFAANIASPGAIHYIYTSLTIVAGTAIAIFIADTITKKGIGNGTSMLIAAGIVTSLPTMIGAVWQRYVINNSSGWDYVWMITIWLLYFAVLFGVVYLQIAKRKIPVQYANRQGKTDSNIPIRLNSAGVIPVIFASTILSIPLMIASFAGSTGGGWVEAIFSYQKPIGYLIYVVLIVIFSFFYSFLTIDPNKIADNLSKSNAYIPSVKPGEDTKNYIAKLLFKITVIGTVYLVLLASLPIFTAVIFGFEGSDAQAITIGGTSILILVGVAIETTQQVETDAEKTEYSGILG